MHEKQYLGVCEAVAKLYDYIDEILLHPRLRTEGWKEPWRPRSGHASELMAEDYAGETERGRAACELGIPKDCRTWCLCNKSLKQMVSGE